MTRGSPLPFRRLSLSLLLATLAALLIAACGGDESTPEPSPVATPTAGAGIETPSTGDFAIYCNPPAVDTTPFELDVKVQWKGSDRITIEGSISTALPPAYFQYLFCQDGQVSWSLVPAREPKLEDGSISAESKLVPSDRGVPFDPNARFEAILFFMNQKTRLPMLMTKVPVEGSPQ